MIVRPDHIAQAMIQLLEQQVSPDIIAKNLNGYLEKYHQEQLYPEIVKYLNKIHKDISDRSLIDIIVARETDVDNETILSILQYHHLNAEYDYQVSENSDLVGGYIVKSQGIVFDNSIRQRLQALKHELLTTR